ncbi:NAD(P)-binding protein, partial [Aureobasidium melanogenum]
MSPILINGNVVDLNSGHPKNATFSLNASKDSEYILIQTKEPLSKREIANLRDLGAEMQECVAENTYLLRYPDDDMQAIRSLRFIDKAGQYQKGLKINSQLQAAASVDPSQTKNVYAVLHQEKNESSEEAARRLAEVANLDPASMTVDGNRVKLTLKLDQLKDLSKLDVVRTIEEVPERVLTNNFARQVLGADVIINDTSYYGNGQVVAVADTGLDRGDLKDVHPAFAGRVRELIPIGRPGKTNDTDGHGTHVCGSILGSKVSSAVDKLVEGIAPQAELVMQSLLNESDGLFPTSKVYPLKQLFVDPYKKHGAHIHSNSWGSVWTGRQLPYGEEARQIDEAVHENPDLLIVFAAGNDGSEWPFATLGSQAAAKNCLTVGATESSRPSINGAYASKKKSPNDTTEISWYSSRGPTQEGRIKPDVVAPGTAILSAKSRDCQPSSSFGKSVDPLWQFSTGTSMATPLVSGCAAVLREALVKNGTTNPSAALLKALLINGSYAFHHAHSAKEGFGRVNLTNSIIIPGKTDHAGFEIGPTLKDRDEENSITVTIPPLSTSRPIADDNESQRRDSTHSLTVNPPAQQGVTLKATLVYTDLPSDTLQNDLNLTVVASDGIRRNGNMGSDSNHFDRYNNVEQVIWKGIPPGDTKIVVRARQVLSDEQAYALTVSPSIPLLLYTSLGRIQSLHYTNSRDYTGPGTTMAGSRGALVVFGSGPGIGRNVAAVFAERGFQKIILLSRNETRLSQDADFVRAASAGASVDVIEYDGANMESVRAGLEEVEKAMGDVSLECVLFNHARLGPSKFFEFTVEELETDLQVSVISLYAVAKWAMPKLIGTAELSDTKTPSFIVTSGMLAKDPFPAMFSLAACKAGQYNLVHSLHKEYESKGVHCALVVVG